jgi:peptidoglycan/xylan/chitin deacetylase (PgdA/CDA1 family)
MLTHRNINIILFVILAALLLVNYLWQPVPWWIFVLLFLPYSGVLVWGAMNVQSGFFMPVVCEGNTTEKVVAITFDDGPLLQHTPEILDILKQQNVPAAFFCIGNRIAGNESLLKRINEEGHIAGNHSYSHHFWFDMFGADKMLAELELTDNTIERAIGKRPRLFRPPYGVTNPNLKKAVKKGKYTSIGWNIRSLDTVVKQPGELMQRITPFIKPGAVILLHDSMEVTVQTLPALIQHIHNEGYRIERIDKLLNIPAYA